MVAIKIHENENIEIPSFPWLVDENDHDHTKILSPRQVN